MGGGVSSLGAYMPPGAEYSDPGPRGMDPGSLVRDTRGFLKVGVSRFTACLNVDDGVTGTLAPGGGGYGSGLPEYGVEYIWSPSGDRPERPGGVTT